MSGHVELRGVDAAYGPFRALFDVDLDLRAGETIALLGPNGAGKSTVARVISGLVPVAAGALFIDGSDASNWSMFKRRRAGILQVPEGRGIFSTLSVEENLKMALEMAPRKERGGLLDEIFERFDFLAERRRIRAGALSGGQQQLLSLAPAIVAPPAALIADEPSLGLDPTAVDDVYASLTLMKEQGVTLLVIEQQIDRVLALADVAVVLDHGRVSFSGPPSGARAALEAGMRR
jgi:ABC-type branched-subunit amino acid transport system ATPase component